MLLDSRADKAEETLRKKTAPERDQSTEIAVAPAAPPASRDVLASAAGVAPAAEQSAQPARQEVRLMAATGGVQAAPRVSYTLLRRNASGQLLPVEQYDPGDTPAIRFLPNAAGHLTVTASGNREPRLLLSVDAASNTEYVTPALSPGETTVAVSFVPAASAKADASSNAVQAFSGGVGRGGGNAPALGTNFVINLPYK
jgi:hypothetical protein